MHGGDRLPWIADADNFVPLASLDWQVHVYGVASPEIQRIAERRALPLHVLGWTPAASSAGLERDAAYLLRPDGYVALADRDGSGARLERYLDDRGLRIDGR